MWRLSDSEGHRAFDEYVLLVMNNGHLGMVRQWQTLFYNNRLSSVELDAFPDAEKLAAAYGFKGRTIDKPWELAAALEEAVKEPGPYLLNVKVTPFECVYPMVPAGGAINEMVLGPPQPVGPGAPIVGPYKDFIMLQDHLTTCSKTSPAPSCASPACSPSAATTLRASRSPARWTPNSPA